MSKRQWNQTTTDLHQSGSRHENPRTGQQDQPRNRPSHIQYANLLFYQGKIPAKPEGVYVDDIHRQWSKDMDRLERNHNYIQWLFPTREDGQNAHAHVLQAGEAAAIAADRDAMKRFFKSYQMMLHFYGLTIVNRGTGEVGRGQNWERQLRNLNASRHNYLRITRILKSLGEMGLERFQAPLVRALLTEAIEKGTLNNARDSCYNYWIPTVRDPGERENLEQYAHRYDTVRKSVESRHQEPLLVPYHNRPPVGRIWIQETGPIVTPGLTTKTYQEGSNPFESSSNVNRIIPGSRTGSQNKNWISPLPKPPLDTENLGEFSCDDEDNEDVLFQIQPDYVCEQPASFRCAMF